MQAKASRRVGVVGDLSAADRVYGGVGFAGGDDLDAARRKQRTQLYAKSQSEGLLRLAAPVLDAAAWIVAAVSGIKNHDKADCGSGRSLGRGRLPGDCEEQ